MADTPTGETVKPGDTQTEATIVTTPAPVDNGNVAEVERLRKEQEQKDLRIRQLENEAAARKKADEEAEAKRLDDNQEYKTLAEQERAKREELERQIEDGVRKEELTTARTSALQDFSDEVRQQAEELGITLNSTDEAEVAAYKDKLTKINTRLANGGNGAVHNQPLSNGNGTMPQGEDLQAALSDGNSFHDLVTKNFPGIAAMTTPKKN
jgi:hypothetical protein